MTVVAWDGRTLAADKRTSFGGLHGTTTKVHRVGDRLVGCAGNAAHVREVIQWLRDGAKPETLPPLQRDEEKGANVLVIEVDGSISYYDISPHPIRLENRAWAIGSGRDFAMAAMHLGKTAREAVEVACHFDSGCGNGIDTLTL